MTNTSTPTADKITPLDVGDATRGRKYERKKRTVTGNNGLGGWTNKKLVNKENAGVT
jgi:hypothetical protein